MQINCSDVKIEETVFSADCGYDGKHINNLSGKEVPAELLRAVEAGCSLETLEVLAAGFPICKYATQITIHGRFPALASHRIGGTYVNLVRNKNKSVGVRWTAIDHEKKARLFRQIRICSKFYVVENSTTFHMEKMAFLRPDTREAVIAEFTAIANRINRSLFTGGVTVVRGMLPMLGEVIALTLNIKAFRAENFDAIVQNVTGLDADGVKSAVAEYEAKKAAEAAEREKRYEESEKRRAEAEAKRKADNAAWIAANAPAEGYAEETVEAAALVEGDMIARPEAVRYGGNYERWGYYRIGKSFGRLTAFPCNADGSKLTGWDRSHKGKQVDHLIGRKARVWVKRAAKKSAPVYAPKAVTVASTATTSPTGAVASTTVTENAEKGGIEIRFPSKPTAAVLTNLKANGWRWSRFGGCWYNRATDEARAFAANFSA